MKPPGDPMHPSDIKRLEREAEIHRATRGPDYSVERDLYRRRMEELAKRSAAAAEYRQRRHAAIAEGREHEL